VRLSARAAGAHQVGELLAGLVEGLGAQGDATDEQGARPEAGERVDEEEGSGAGGGPAREGEVGGGGESAGGGGRAGGAAARQRAGSGAAGFMGPGSSRGDGGGAGDGGELGPSLEAAVIEAEELTWTAPWSRAARAAASPSPPARAP